MIGSSSRRVRLANWLMRRIPSAPRATRSKRATPMPRDSISILAWMLRRADVIAGGRTDTQKSLPPRQAARQAGTAEPHVVEEPCASQLPLNRRDVHDHLHDADGLLGR